jgi:2-desacetyl-2-hydroxyethyl bacteriochlorophyllide A dehydrogenase
VVSVPKRIVFPEKGRVELQEFDLPNVGPSDIQVRTLYSLMSIGTETTILHQKYAPGTHYDRIFSFPQLKTGVQAIAKVESIGPAVKDFQIGDRIYMRMAHGSHQVIAEALCSPVPDGIDLKSGCWCGLAKTAYRAAWAGRFEPGGSVLIIGAGPVGQMTVRWASAMGVSELVVTDLSALRLDHATRGGATLILPGSVDDFDDEISQMNNGEGPPLVVDTTGSPAVFPLALAVAGRFGKILVLGDSGFPGKQCLTSDVMTKGLTIQATHDSHDVDGWTQRRVDALFFDLVRQGKFDLKRLITHEFPPTECGDAYALASEHREQAVGILYDWTGAI